MIRPLAITTLLSLASLSLADVKAVIKINVSGGPRMSGGAGERTVTILQTAGKLRVERQEQSQWVLVDSTGKFLIDDAAKTYSLLPARSGGGEKPSSTVKLTKRTETKDIFGMTATRCDLSGKVTVQPQSGGGGRGRRFGGGNGMSLSLDGTLWTVADFKGFGFSDLLGERGQAFSGMGDQLSGAGLPLEGTITVNLPPMARGKMESPKISFVTESLETKPLDVGLFSIPSGYSKVDPPVKG